MLRDDLAGSIEPIVSCAGAYPLALSAASKKSSDDRSGLENLRPEGAELSLTENVSSSFHLELRHYAGEVFRTVGPDREQGQRIGQSEASVFPSLDPAPDPSSFAYSLLYTHDLAGKLISINPAAALILGYTVEEMLEMPMREFIVPEFREKFEEYLTKIQRDGVARGLACVGTKAGLRTVWKYESTLHTAADTSPTVQGVGRDITERRLAENSLSLLRLLIDHSNDAIEVVDPQTLRFLDVNRKACLDLGYSREELLSLSVPDVDCTMDKAMQTRVRDALYQAGALIRENIHRRKDGTTFPVEVNIKHVQHAGRDYAITVVRDITERKRVQDALLQSEKRLQILLEISNAIVSKLEPKDLFPAISSSLHAVFHQELAAISLYEREHNAMRIYAMDPPLGDALVGLATPVSACLAGEAFSRDEVTFFQRSDLEARNYEVVTRSLAFGIQSVCFVPLKSPSGSIGVLALSSKRDRAFDEIDTEFAKQVATQVAIALDNARAYRRIEELNHRLNEEKVYIESELQTALHFDEIVGDSPALTEVMQQITRIASTDTTVLILGQTGTGKELVARAIHKVSARSAKAFVKMNCSAVPSGLLESELFGHEKGAFTNAFSQKIGRLELADGGTFFLDEIGEMPLELQPKLLRVLQDLEFERLGSTRTIRVNMRLIAATNRDLGQAMSEGTFRSDLYYRLNVFPIRMPALSERRSDIPKLVAHFVAKYAKRMNKCIETVPSQTIERLTNWDWPGNIRELENFIERSVILTPGATLQAPLSELEAAPISSVTSGLSLESVERDYIVRVLQERRGLIAGPNGAAARLGMKRTTLQSKIQRLGISPHEYRSDPSYLPSR
jgi:formate hydrogenlyase transcriptional activator